MASSWDASRLHDRLGAVAEGSWESPRGAALSGLAVTLIRGGELAYEGYFGRRLIDEADPSRDLPVGRGTKFRVASISKTVAAIGAMTLADEGLLDLDADLSSYLGFELRNPLWPREPITAAMLLSHTSSIRDGSGYSLPLGREMPEFFLPEAGHFGDRRPGEHYSYANLGYGLLASAMERASGRRFDILMRERVLAPLGIDGGYNVLQLSDSGFASLATLYRRGDDEGHWEPRGPWRAQVDDYRGARPLLPCKAEPGLGPADLAAYVPGSNGTLFSPQGGLRISAFDLSRIELLLMGYGALGDARIISEASARRMMTVAWRFDAAAANGDLEDGSTRATGLGLVRTTRSLDAFGGDRLLPGGGPAMWGHHAEAYGLLGGMLFDPDSASGFVYLIGGTPCDPASRRGAHYSRSIWEERIIEALADCLA